MKMIIRRCALSYAKYRNSFGFILVEVDTDQKQIIIRASHQWSRTNISVIANDISSWYRRFNWDVLYLDQFVGEHLIQDIRKIGVPCEVITVQNNLKDPKNIQNIKTMDKKEQVQWMIQLLDKHQIKFPKSDSTKMVTLREQIERFSEHKTESGVQDYYAPGELLDDLTKALMIACFSVRRYFIGGDGSHVGGVLDPYGKQNTLELETLLSNNW